MPIQIVAGATGKESEPMHTTDRGVSEDEQAMWLHPMILAVVTLLGACLVLFHAVGIFGYLVSHPRNPAMYMMVECVVCLLIGGWLLFVALREMARWLLSGTKYARYAAVPPRSTKKSLLPPLTALFFGLVALGFAVRVAFYAAGDYFMMQQGMPLLFVTVPLGCLLVLVSIRGINDWCEQ